MNRAEITRILAKCVAYDNRTVGETDVEAWIEAIGDVDFIDALPAVSAHYRASTDWAMPAHIREHAAAAKRARLRSDASVRQMLAGVSAVAVTGDRRAARVAEVSAAIPRPRSKSADDAPTAWDALCGITDGPTWPDPEETR